MNIHAKKGDKIIYTHRSDMGERFLVLNKTYTIERTKIYNWHTDVFLREVPSVRFNSVIFEDVDFVDTSNPSRRYPCKKF